MNNFDTKYLSITRDILENGIDRSDRTGIGSKAIWVATLRHNMSEGFPIITHRRVGLRLAFEELMMMLRGQTDTNILKNKNIHIWNGNTTREFLDKRGLNYLPEGNMGKAYGFQIRNFGGDYAIKPWADEYSLRDDPKNKYDYSKYDGNGTDQLKALLDGLKDDPNGRRHIIIHWNPSQLKEAALPSCHLYHQYQILDGKLNSSFVMRSWDWCFGAPYNFIFYGLLNLIISKYLGIEPGDLCAVGMDVHIYENQKDMAIESLNRTLYKLPTVDIKKEINTMEDILSLKYEDIAMNDYTYNPDFKNKPKMAI